MHFPLRLALRHLMARKTRNGLTIVAISIAAFLLCFLIAIVQGLEASVQSASTTRLVTQSAVSLFVDLPTSYQHKIDAVEGVHLTTKFRWFGAYYQARKNFFAQFAVDQDRFLDMYTSDIEIVEGPGGVTGPEARIAVQKAFESDRRAAIIGTGLRDNERFGFQIGDQVPLIPMIYPRTDGSAWEFVIVGCYRPLKARIPDTTMYFRADYLNEAIVSGEAFGDHGAGVYYVNTQEGVPVEQIAEEIDALFANGPQRTQTITEAAFASFFVSAIGNLPLFLGTIGGAVLFSIFFSVVNTMMITGRQRLQEAGILQALGFRPLVSTTLLVFEGLVISLIGGGGGILIAYLSEGVLAQLLGQSIQNYQITPDLVLMAIGTSSVLGIVAGLAAGLPFLRSNPTEALRSSG
ncbi:MAG: ABC transporter permease [Planctomycetota bacterium]